jgi:hypothetical protein
MLHVGNQSSDPFQIGAVHQVALTEISFPLCALLGQDMAGEGLTPDDLAGAGGLEPFGRPAIGFHFWHDNFSSKIFSPASGMANCS